MTKRNNNNGNALFLILIAVALFAALSYAITQSGRGGGSTDREQVQIKAAELVQKVQMMHSTIQRAYLTGGYDQIFPNTDAETNSGTCYKGGNSYSPCRSVGIFNEQFNLPVLDTTPYRSENPGNNVAWRWSSRRVYIESDDIGSAEADEYISVFYVQEDICREINRQLQDTTDIPSTSFTNTDSPGRTGVDLRMNGTIDSPSVDTGFSSMIIPYEPLCVETSGSYYYIHIFKRR
ncbi:MAG: hypothetical protein ACQEQL_03210 [Pseudomonadota bacterium]